MANGYKDSKFIAKIAATNKPCCHLESEVMLQNISKRFWNIMEPSTLPVVSVALLALNPPGTVNVSLNLESGLAAYKLVPRHRHHWRRRWRLTALCRQNPYKNRLCATGPVAKHQISRSLLIRIPSGCAVHMKQSSFRLVSSPSESYLRPVISTIYILCT